MSCPFCSIEKLTEWFLVVPTHNGQIVVVEDLNKREYKMRLLVVGSGKAYHRVFQAYNLGEVQEMIDYGLKIANQLIQEGRFREIAKIDVSHFSIKDHWHYQLGMV